MRLSIPFAVPVLRAFLRDDILNGIGMPTERALTMLCLASYEKGRQFLDEARRQGCRVLLLTSQSLQGKWEPELYDDIYYMPDKEFEWNLQHMLQGVNHLCRTERIERIVPLDDFDLEKAAMLREHLRIAGLGETATRYFRDKLAMRMRAAENGILVPAFTATFNYEAITAFLERVPPPWVLKPRLLAGAMGIRKCHSKEEVWENVHRLGDEQSYFVLERFVPGDIFHVDSIWFSGEVVFAIASAYGTPPLEVVTGGGIFTTETMEVESELSASLLQMNQAVLRAFSLRDGVSHTEFIKAHADGALYFLETSARVGGANIADLIQAATGINMWAEWAKVETAAAAGGSYKVAEHSRQQAGLLVSLARQEWPDTSNFSEPELIWRMNKRHHVGFIVKSSQRARIGELLKLYTERVRSDFHASAPPRDKPGE
jgi:carbamoylphosphate synthase large subunit